MEELKEDKERPYLGQAQRYAYKFFPLVAIAVFAAVSFACYHLILRPKYDAINNEIKQAVEARRESKELLEQYLQRLARYSDSYRSVPQPSKDKVEALFNSGDPEVLFAQFEAIAKNQGVILSSLAVKSPDGGGKAGLSTAHVSASFIGLDYRGLKNFLAYLETALPLVDITSLKFSGDAVVAIEADTYFLN